MIRSRPHPSWIGDRLSDLEAALIAADGEVAQLTRSIEQLDPEKTASDLKQALRDTERRLPAAQSAGDARRLDVLRRRYDAVHELMNQRERMHDRIADSVAHLELLAVETVRSDASAGEPDRVEAHLEQLSIDVEALNRAREEIRTW